jgi:hypothetical protein
MWAWVSLGTQRRCPAGDISESKFIKAAGASIGKSRYGIGTGGSLLRNLMTDKLNPAEFADSSEMAE